MLYPSSHTTGKYPLNRPVTWAVLVFITIVLLTPLVGADMFLNQMSLSSGQALGARLAIYFAPLGLFSIFVGVVCWDTWRTGAVRILLLYRRVGYILVPFGLISILSIAYLWHPTAYWGEHERHSSLMAFWPLLYFFILFFSVSLAAIPAVVKHYRAIFTLSFIVLVVTLLSEALFSIAYPSVYAGRAVGLHGQPDVAGQLTVILSVASVNWRKPRRLDGIIWLVAGVTVALTLSRIGLLSYGFALVAYLALVAKLRMRVLLQFAIFAILLASILLLGRTAIASLSESNDFYSRVDTQRISMLIEVISGDMEAGISDDSARQRIRVWNAAKDLISESPILGHGTNFTYADPNFRLPSQPGLLGPVEFKGAHNIYLKQWVENGLLGLGFLLAFYFASFWHFMRYKDVRGVIFIAVCSLTGLTADNLLQQVPFIIMIGLLGALAYVEYLELSASRSSLPKA